MPTFALKCDTCQHAFEAFHTMKADHPACPECGKPTRVDWTRQPAPATVAHDLHGTRMTPPDIQAQAREVPQLRKLYGNIGRCWNADGSVTFTHKDDAKKFYAKDQAIRRRFKDQKAEGKLKAQPKAIRDKQGRVVKEAPKARPQPAR